MNNYKQAKKILDNADLIYTADQIQQTIEGLAKKINAKFNNELEPVIIMPIMNGGLVLSGQLIPLLNFPLVIDYIHATRYRDETSGGALQWKVKPGSTLENKKLLIVDDIFDEGHTLKNVIDFCQQENAAQVTSAVLIEKNHPREKADVQCDFVGMCVEDRYVFGFGMDYKGYLRNLNGIYAVSESNG